MTINKQFGDDNNTYLPILYFPAVPCLPLAFSRHFNLGTFAFGSRFFLAINFCFLKTP